MPLDTFLDESPNYDREEGFTLPRINGLLTAYKKRRGRELRETAIAFNDPEKLDEFFPLPQVKPQKADAPMMETERWW